MRRGTETRDCHQSFPISKNQAPTTHIRSKSSEAANIYRNRQQSYVYGGATDCFLMAKG